MLDPLRQKSRIVSRILDGPELESVQCPDSVRIRTEIGEKRG